MRRLAGGGVAFFCSLFCLSVRAEQSAQQAPHPMRVSVRHIESEGIGYNQGYTTLEGFFSPIRPAGDVWIPFIDLRGHVFNHGQLAANTGIGLRYLTCSRVWGANVYYDYRKTRRQHYNQIAAGLESLGKVWDFRINGYLPLGKTRSGFWGSCFDHFQGHYAFLSGKREFALKGGNAEAAAHVYTAKNVDITTALGPYYLSGQGKSTWGGQARVAVDLFRYCTLTGYTSYDGLFGWTGQGQLRVVIPFGGKRTLKKRTCQSDAMAAALAARGVQSVNRFEIIPVDRKRSHAKALDPLTGKPYVFWFVDNTSHSLGTFESPFSTLIAAQNASTSGDVIYVFAGDETSTGMDVGITLKEDQFLFGAGISHILQTTTGKMLIPPQATGLPHLTAPVGNSVVTVASNNSISGFQITSDANAVVGGSYCIGSSLGEMRDLFISQNTLIADNGAVGIMPKEPSGEITITGNVLQSVDGQGAYGIYLSQMSGKGFYTIENNRISNFQNLNVFPPNVPSGTGIAILVQNQSEVSAVISENQISGCVGYAIDCHAFGTGTPILSAVIKENRLEGVPLTGAGTFLLSDDGAVMTFQLLNNRITTYAFGMIAQAEGVSSMTGLIQNNFLSSGPLGSGMIFETNFITQTGSATGVFKVIANDISFYGDAQGISTSAYGTSSLTASIEQNDIHDIGKAGLYLNGFDSSVSNLIVIDNLITNNNGGMEINSKDNSRVNARVQGNVVTGNNGAGLFAHSIMNSNAKHKILENTFANNNLTDLNTGSAVTFFLEDAASSCLRMQNNQSTLEATQPDYDLDNAGSGQLRVEPLTGNTGTINQSGTTSVPAGFCGS